MHTSLSWTGASIAMSLKLTSILVIFTLLPHLIFAQNISDVLKYVDPLIGSANGGMFLKRVRVWSLANSPGNVFPGATLPYGIDAISSLHPPFAENYQAWPKQWRTWTLVATKGVSQRRTEMLLGSAPCMTVGLVCLPHLEAVSYLIPDRWKPVARELCVLPICSMSQ